VIIIVVIVIISRRIFEVSYCICKSRCHIDTKRLGLFYYKNLSAMQMVLIS